MQLVYCNAKHKMNSVAPLCNGAQQCCSGRLNESKKEQCARLYVINMPTEQQHANMNYIAVIYAVALQQYWHSLLVL